MKLNWLLFQSFFVMFILIKLSSRIVCAIRTDCTRIDGFTGSFNDPKLLFSTHQQCFCNPQSTLRPNSNGDGGDSEDMSDEQETLLMRRHNLARCPANAAGSFADLTPIDATTTDFSTFLNITDKQNRTLSQDDQHFESESELDVQQIQQDESEKQTQSTQRIIESDSILVTQEEKPSVERHESPPPIATFEEWTKEKLMNKDKKPTLKDAHQNAVMNSGNGVTATEPIPASGQLHNQGTDSSQENLGIQQLTIQSSINTAETTGNLPPVVNDPVVLVPTSTQPEIAKRNYASKECGAKVLLTNPEAEHRNAVLNDKERDEYMRNPCEKAQNKFFIIELCETIQPNFLELANFELFSSGPRDIRLSISERYPTVEWTPVGQFVAADTREMQSFYFNSPGIYVKFIKLDLLSHYKNEHYCTLSTVRISGISMVDEYEAEASNSMDVGTIVTQPVEPALHLTETTQPVETVEVITSSTSVENQKTDASNDSNESNKPFVLNKVVDIVGNLGQIKNVIGKTFLGNRVSKELSGEIWPNTCTHYCPITFEMNEQCQLKCHYFNLIEFPTKKFDKVFVPSVLSTLVLNRSHAQQQFFDSILRSSECPAVVAEPKRVETDQIKLTDNAKEQLKADVIVNETLTKNEQKPDEQKSGALFAGNPNSQPSPTVQKTNQQQFQAPKAPPVNSLPGTVSTHKESVFMKLNKRLSALELNISLSSEYLSELSRRYVAQQDGYNKQHERDLKTLEEMVSRLGDNLKMVLSKEINQIRNDLKDLSDEVNHVKRIAQHSSCATSSDVLSLTVVDHSSAPFEDHLYKMLPPAQEPELDPRKSRDLTAWTNDQIVAVITLSNLSLFTLVACLYLLYKIFSLRQRIQSRDLRPDEIKAIVQKELDQLRRSSSHFAPTKKAENVVLINSNIQPSYDKPFTSKRYKRNKHRQQQAGLQSVTSPTLSMASTAATTSTSALDTMSSSPSLSDIDQIETKTFPLIVDAMDKQLKLVESEKSARLSPNSTAELAQCDSPFHSCVSEKLSPSWKTVQNRRKSSDKSLKGPSSPTCNASTKIKVN